MSEINKTGEYGMRAIVPVSVEEARKGIESSLNEEGFGILTEIDVRAVLKEKIGVDFDEYIILGACNPGLAHHALSIERDIGLLLPCNVVVYRTAESDETTVAIIDPEVGLGMVEVEELKSLGAEAKFRLARALADFAGRVGKGVTG